MYELYPSKSAPVKPEQQTGPTGPGLKTNATGQVTKNYPSQAKGNSMSRADTPTPKGGTETYPKRGAKQTGTNKNQEGAASPPVPGDIQKTSSPGWNLRSPCKSM